MNRSQIIILKTVCSQDGVERDEMKNKLGVREWQFLSLVRGLVDRRFIIRDHKKLHLADTFDARIISKLNKDYDLNQLLLDSNEKILGHISEGVEVNDICKSTGLSRATVYRALSDFESLGIIKRVIMLNTTAEIKLFSNTTRGFED